MDLKKKTCKVYIVFLPQIFISYEYECGLHIYERDLIIFIDYPWTQLNHNKDGNVEVHKISLPFEPVIWVT